MGILIHQNLNESVAYKRTVDVSDLCDSFSQKKIQRNKGKKMKLGLYYANTAVVVTPSA
jgi:hypothetical protein